MADKDRRWQLLHVSEDLLLHALLGSGPGEVDRYCVDGLPEGWRVERVVHDDVNATFLVLIWHPSFDSVPPGQKIPDASCQIRRMATQESWRDRPALF